MKLTKLSTGLLFTLLFLSNSVFGAKRIELSPLFTNHMVIQREKPVVVWGKTAPNNQVQVNINNVGKAVISDANGYFETTFDPLPVGGPYELQISGNDTTIRITNILSGDVWLCSGQSNMAWQFMNDQFFEEESTNTDIPNLRTIRIGVKISVDSLNSDAGSNYWLKTTYNSARLFSAVGFYFGRKLATETSVPIGLIGSYWGGSPIEAWMSKDGLSEFSEFSPFLEELGRGEHTVEDLKLIAEENARLRREGLLTDPMIPYAEQHFPTAVYNGMIAPIIKYPIKGVIWDQGGGNAPRAWQYYSLFPAMINDWRQKFNNPDMPFYFVQSSPYGRVLDYPHDNQRAQIRDAQNNTFSIVPNTQMVVTLDIGDCTDLHPRNKRDVGYRFADLALKNLYGFSNINPEFPTLKSYQVIGNTIVCEFDNVGDGLLIEGGDVTEFTIAGDNEVFVTAEASIIAKNKIELKSQFVPAPVAVRYTWSSCPTGGLVFNSYKLPLGTFRTDKWRISTQPVDTDQSDLIVMKTEKAINSEISLRLVVGGESKVWIDWGDGTAHLIDDVSSHTGYPTDIKGNTAVEQAEIRIVTEKGPILYLTCASNELSMLDVTGAPLLQALRCNTNNLDTIDLSANRELLTLHIHQNNLTSLDVSNNQKLTDLQFGTNKVSTLAGTDKLMALRTLSAMVNPLGEIDVSFNPVLQYLNLRNCGLTKLDVSKATKSLTTIEIFNGGNTYSNRFSACGLDSLYHSLPDRTGMTNGVVRVIYSNAKPFDNDAHGSNKDIANAKNWEVMTYAKEILTGDGEGCPDPSGLKNVSASGNALKLSPNPAQSVVQIQAPDFLLDDKLKVYNTLGKKIKEVIIDSTTPLIQLDVSALARGIYMLQLNDYTGKLVKH